MALMTKVLWGTKVQGTKVLWGTKVRGTKVLRGTKILFHWEGDESPGTKALGSKVGGMKVLQPIKNT